MKRRIFLIIWILGIIFPMIWLGRFSPWFKQHFEIIFSKEWVHWILHVILYAGLTILLISTFDLKLTMKVFTMILLISLVIGLVQEGFQQIASYIPKLRWNSLFDLGVNLAGTLIGFSAVALYKRLN